MTQPGSLNIKRMGQLAPVSRGGFYSLQQWQPMDEQMAVRTLKREENSATTYRDLNGVGDAERLFSTSFTVI